LSTAFCNIAKNIFIGGVFMNERLFARLAEIVDGQKRLAEALGISPKTISAWKTRATSPPSKYIPQIAEFIGVSVDWLVTGEGYSGGSVHVAGPVSHGAVVAGVNHGRVVTRQGGRERVLSVESGELLRLYDSLDIKRRLKLLELAVLLSEEKEGEKANADN
jgi:transcriptional regulator with XRE-family HTH domain